MLWAVGLLASCSWAELGRASETTTTAAWETPSYAAPSPSPERKVGGMPATNGPKTATFEELAPAIREQKPETSQIGLRQQADPKGMLATERNTIVLEVWGKTREACADVIKVYEKKVVKSVEKARKDSEEMEGAFRKCGERGRTMPVAERVEKATPLEAVGTERNPDEAELARVGDLVRRGEGYEAEGDAEHDCKQIPNSDAVRHGKKHAMNLMENLAKLRARGAECLATLGDVAIETVLSEAQVVLTEGKRLDAVSEEDRRAILRTGAEGAADGVLELAKKYGPEVALSVERLDPRNAEKTTAIEIRNAAQEIGSLSDRASAAIEKMLAAMPEVEKGNRGEIDGLKSVNREVALQQGAADVKMAAPASTAQLLSSQSLVNGKAPPSAAEQEVVGQALKLFESHSSDEPRPPAKFVHFTNPR
jgi:hypothetical protein